jgi:hypothetical protein
MSTQRNQRKRRLRASSSPVSLIILMPPCFIKPPSLYREIPEVIDIAGFSSP